MEQITMIKTKDGVLHPDIEKAKDHLNDKLRARLDVALRGTCEKYHISRNHIVELITYLFPDYDTAHALVRDLYDLAEDEDD